MIESMPNILKDQGVKEDIRIKVEMLMNEACGHLAITEEMRNYELLNKQVKKGDKQ